MAAEDNYKRLRELLDERLKADKRLEAIALKIAKGTADFNDTARYSQIVAKHLGDVISENIGSITVPLGKELVCKELLRDHYERINDVLGDVQASVDDKLGIHLNPVKAPYPTERIDKGAHSLEDPTVPEETIERRARSVTENIANSMHDDYIKENAGYRGKAGLKSYLVRETGAGGCCKWCAALAGRYDYATAPDDVFRRHDNCNCTVTYECGRQRQDVWSKKSWDASPEELKGRREFSDNSRPKVFTREQAKKIDNQLILQAKPGRDDNAVADMSYINSQAFADKFKGKYENEKVENAIISACRQLVKNRNGTFFEEAYFIDAKTGKTISYIKGKQKYGIEMSDELKNHLTNAREKSIIMIHNHPNSSPLSRTDFLTSSEYKCWQETIAVGHNGDVYSFKNTYGTQGELLGYFVDNGKSYPYYEAIRDYRVSYTKHSKDNDENEARNLAWKEVSRIRGFVYEKR